MKNSSIRYVRQEHQYLYNGGKRKIKSFYQMKFLLDQNIIHA